jgi:hypothetical protein
MSQALFVLSNTLAAAIAYLAADMAMAGREPWRRALAAVAGFPVVVLVVVLILGSVGHLSAGSTVLMVGVAAAAMTAVRWGLQAKGGAKSTAVVGQHKTPESENLVRLISLTLLGGFSGVAIVHSSVLGTSFHFDDLSYHAPAVAHWIVDGRISLAPFNYHAYYPFNAEVLSLWFMLPFHSDGLASLSGLYWEGLTVIASAALVLAQGQSRTTAVLLGALLLGSPILMRAARTFSAVDVAGPALMLAAAALAVPSPSNQSRHAKLVDASYSGLLSGLAAGCRVSFAPVTVVLFLWQAFGLRKNYSLGTRALSAVFFAVAATATGAYWYVRNWVLTGNPLFPAELGPFNGPFGVEAQTSTKLVSWIASSTMDLSLSLFLVKSHINWPAGLFLLATVGYGSALLSVIRYRASIDKTTIVVRSLLLVIGSVLLFLYPFMPFSGTYNEPHASLTISLRYLIAPFAIGIVLFGSQVNPGHPHRTFWLCLAILAAVATRHPDNLVAIVSMAAGAGVLWLGKKGQGLFSSQRVTPAMRLTGIPVALLLIALWAPYKQRLTDAKIYNYREPADGTLHPFTRAWQALEAVPKGSRVSWFGSGSYQYYPVFGRKLHLIPTQVNADGSHYQPMHELFRHKPFQWWGSDGEKSEQDLSRLLPNLVAIGVDYLLVTKRNQDEGVRLQAALANSGQAQPIYEDGYSVIWRISRINS